MQPDCASSGRGTRRWPGVPRADPRAGQPVFRTYTQLPRRVPIRAWRAVRAVSAASYVALVIGLFVSPAGGLFVFFRVIVPVLPLIFFSRRAVAQHLPALGREPGPAGVRLHPGVHAPGLAAPSRFAIALVFFFGITSARHALFNTSGAGYRDPRPSRLPVRSWAACCSRARAAGAAASARCCPSSSAYGQTPFVTVPNSHCQPCLGCTKNCYDFQPQAAYQADLHDADSAGCPRASCSPPPCLVRTRLLHC